MSNDFYHAYLYHQENCPGYDLEWFRLWDFCRKDTGEVIGGACFKGQPDAEGCVEVGYGVDDAYQNQGFATEAIGALADMAVHYPGVKAVLFEIERDNQPSVRVAEKLGAHLYREIDGMLWYRYEVS